MAMAASDESRVSLRWVNFSNHAVTLLQQSLIDEDTCDVTLVAAADYTHCTASVKAHKLVIAASSPLFHTILKQNNVSHPIIVLQDITTSSLQALVSYIYNGEVIVPESELADFLKSAELLKIKGLVIDESSRPSTKNSQKTKSQKENKKPKKSNNVNYEHYDENAEDDSFFEKLQPKIEPPDMCVEAIINELPEELMGENDFIHDIKQDEESECQKRFEKVPCKRKSKYKKKNIHEECPKTKFFREEIPPSPACEDNPCTEEDSTEDAEYRDINYQNEFENSIRQILNNHETNNEFCKDINATLPTKVYSNPVFPCPFCTRVYHSWGYRRRHVRSRHGTNSLACKWCLILLGSQAEWFEHAVSMHGLTKTEARDSLIVMVEAHSVLTSLSPTPSALIDQLEIEKFDTVLEEKE